MPTFASVSKDKDMSALRIPTRQNVGILCFLPSEINVIYKSLIIWHICHKKATTSW